MEDELWQAIAILANGEIAGLIIYTNKNGLKVIYPKPSYTPSSSPAQLQARDRFKRAQAAWAALSSSDKALLELAVLRSSLPLTGQNLYLRLAMQTNQGKRLTLIRNTGLPLPPIPFVPYLP